MVKTMMLGGLLGLSLIISVSEVSAQGGRGSEYVGPGSGTGMGRSFGPGSGTGMGRCRPVRVKVCRRGSGDGRGPRCRIEERVRC
jgi:hypothetical protein